MKKNIVLLSFLMLSLIVYAQSSGRKEYLSKGSTSYFDIAAMQAVAQSRSFQRANFLLEKRDYHIRNGRKLNDGSLQIYYSKNVYSENDGKEFFLKPIAGETICSDVIIKGKDGGDFSIVSCYYFPPEDLVDQFRSEAEQLGYKFTGEEKIGMGMMSYYKGNADRTITINHSASAKRLEVWMENFDPEKVKKENEQKTATIAKTKGIILNPSGYLNGSNPQLTTININDVLKLHQGKTVQFAKNYLSSKGYKYVEYDGYSHFWQKGTNEISTFTTLVAEYSKSGLRGFEIKLYNDKTFAALLVQLEKQGYKLKYKNPYLNYEYYFVKEGSSIVFAAIAKEVISVKKATTYIEYEIDMMTSAVFESIKSNGKAKDL